MKPNFLTKNTLPARVSPALGIKLAASDIEAGVITGYASTFGGAPDSYGDVIAPGAFAKSLAEIRAEGIRLPMLWAHKPDEIIGHWTQLEEDRVGLKVRGKLNLTTTRGKDAHQHLANGDVSGLSIGFALAKSQPGPGGVHLLTELHLVEISVTAFPANRRAQVDKVKSKAELADLLHDQGFSRAAAQRIAAGGFPALSREGSDLSNATQVAERIRRATESLRKS